MALYKLHNESELLNLIATGDEHAFAILFQAYYNQIGEFVQLLTHNMEITEEIVQEVFTKIWINRQSLSQINRFDAYLFILCRNHTLNHIRKLVAERSKQEEYVRVAEKVDKVVDADESKDYHGLIEKAVRLLPAQQQQVFVLRQQGFKNPEISQQMNLSIESVKKYQYLAMRFIRKFVKAEALISMIWAFFFCS